MIIGSWETICGAWGTSTLTMMEDDLDMMEDNIDMMEDDLKMYKIYHYFKLSKLFSINSFSTSSVQILYPPWSNDGFFRH